MVAVPGALWVCGSSWISERLPERWASHHHVPGHSASRYEMIMGRYTIIYGYIDDNGTSKSSILEVSWNSGTSKSSILIGFSIINHPFGGTLILGNHHMVDPIPGRKTCNHAFLRFAHQQDLSSFSTALWTFHAVDIPWQRLSTGVEYTNMLSNEVYIGLQSQVVWHSLANAWNRIKSINGTKLAGSTCISGLWYS